MKTRKFKDVFFICFFFVLSSTVIHADEQDLEFCAEREKIYLDPSEISVTEEGIFLIQDNQLVELLGLFCDNVGVFTTLKQIKTTNCDIIAHGSKCGTCGGCYTPKCWKRCRCRGR